MQVINAEYRTMPTVGDPKPTTVVAVLSQDAMGQYAVYIGAVDLNDYNGDPDAMHKARKIAESWIAAHGSKLTYHKALEYFPRLQESEYRR